MKKRKIVLLLTIILIATGCEAKYNLTIDENKMVETASFFVDNNEENQEILTNYLQSNYMAYYNMDNRKSYNYEKEEIYNDNNIGMKLKYTYLGDNLKKSSLLEKCYYKKSIIKTENEIVISTDGKATCFYKDSDKLLDKLTINIKTDLKVIENNADKVKGNTYTWIIDDSNYQNKPINMRIDLTEEEEESYTSIVLLCIFGGIIIAVLSVIIYMYIRNRKNNKL